MLFTLMNWIWIFLCCLGFGLFISDLFGNLGIYRSDRLSEIVMMGFAALSVYANIYSLFGNLAFRASVIMGIISLAGIALHRHFIIKQYRSFSFGIRETVVAVAVIFIMLMLTVSEPVFIDTYLYHAQDIEWMEKYGVVRGLGNLFVNHAYNSVFLQMQALFSWQWLCGKSLHGLNGFICLFFIFHCISDCLKSLKDGTFLMFSNMVRLLEIYYIVFAAAMISSPGTDISSLLIILYIIEKWSVNTEKGERDTGYYGVLSLFIIVAATFKLSVAAMGILILLPFFLMVMQGSFKELTLFALISLIIIVPYLLRSYYLSGYLLYPYGSIDIFDVRWKIPYSYVETDINNIISYGRLLNDPDKAGLPLNEWFPVWFTEIGIFYKFLFIIDMASVTVIIIETVIMIMKKPYEVFLALSLIVGFAGWMLSAPLVRYGSIFMIILPVAAFSLSDIRYSGQAAALLMAAFILLAFGKSVYKYDNHKFGDLLFPADYREAPEEGFDMGNGVTIFYPTAGEYPGYDLFPSVPEESWIYGLHMMGDDLKDGFMR